MDPPRAAARLADGDVRGDKASGNGMRRKLLSIGLILLALAGSGARAQQLRLAPDRPLLFIDAQGTLVRSTDFQGKWLLVYFGYTHCSDLCPTGLSVMASALEQIGAAGDHVQPLFVTVDPERDRGPLLRAFTASFDRRLIGLSGSVEQIRRAADALGVSFRKVASGETDYVVDHSSSYTLIDPAHTHAELLRIAEPHVLASKLIEVLTKAGVPLDHVNNVAAYR
jgi:cytochrome oxidase Cu insertion factor (SCO1/SenC/PrrC family)